jgi:anti-anti-sigma regulatory factor
MEESMTLIAGWLKINEECVVQALREAGETLDSCGSELLLDFSSMRRIDPRAIRGMEEFAGLADGKGVKVVLRGVNVDVYRVFKLVKLTSRFSFVS